MLANERGEREGSRRSHATEASIVSGPVDPLHDGRSGRVFVESWLEKKAEWRRTWERRYVTLDGNRIAYRLAEDSPEKQCGTVASLDCDTGRSDLVITVWLLEGGCWTLRAPQLSVYERWLEALLTVLLPSGMSFDGTNLNGPSVRAMSNHHSTHDEGPSLSTTGGGDSGGATSHAPHPTASSAINTPWGPLLLSAHVEKLAAWTGRWKNRIIELYDGNQLAYKASETASVRQRFTVTAVDLAVRTSALLTSSNSDLASVVGCLLLVSTTVGERFWLKFAMESECRRWYQAILACLRARCSWHWQALPEDVAPSLRLVPDTLSRSVAAGMNLVLDANGNHNYINFRAQYHCATVAPFTSSRGCVGTVSSHGSGMGHSLFVYGGTNRTCMHVMHPRAKAVLPCAKEHSLLNSLSMLQLFGSHSEQAVQILPCEEKQHVKVKPPPLFGATLTSLYKRTTGVQLNRTSVSAVQAVMVGGLSTGSLMSGLARAEVWSAVLSPPAHLLADGTNTVPAPRFQEHWRRATFPTYDLPMLAFHAATDVSRVVDDALDRAITRPSEPTDPRGLGTIMITGGLDGTMRARGECYLLRWPYEESTEKASTGPTVSFFGFLPEPRAFHGIVTLQDGTVVLVGGRSVGNQDVTPILTLPPTALTDYMSDITQASPAKQQTQQEDTTCPWRCVQWHSDQWALPPLPDASVAVTETGDRVVVLAQLRAPRAQVKLFVLSFEDLSADTGAAQAAPPHTMRVKWQEIALKVGAVPRSVVGASVHVHNGYLYVLGAQEPLDGALDDGSPITVDDEGVLSGESGRMYGPLRVLMPSPTGDTEDQ